MAFFDFTNRIKRRKKKTKKEKGKIIPFSEFLNELGVAREGIISTYDAEENPDNLGPSTYINMQDNDGEVRSIVRLLSLPLKSTPISIIPAKNDKGERDFIDTVFNSPPNMGGMTTPLSFVIADMTRAVFEGFRLYEKVARIIEEGEYAGKVGWKKLAPRDASTITLKADEHGGFNGARQETTFGDKTIEIDIPTEKCILFTFQKERHWLYGESILKTAYYHYDKKHKLYYIAHKKAEIESMGLKILKINSTMTAKEREAAEEVVDQIGINSRVTIPPGVELEIERGGDGYDPLPLIEHHNKMMARSALTQATDQEKYAYPYGSGTPASQFLVLAIESIMRQMEVTLNTYAIAPLIDWNFTSKAYPRLQFDTMADTTQVFLREVFEKIMKNEQPILPEGFVNEIIAETAKSLKLKWVPDAKDSKKKVIRNRKAAAAFEKGKLTKANELQIKAPLTPQKLREKLWRVRKGQEFENKCFKLGQKFAYGYES